MHINRRISGEMLWVVVGVFISMSVALIGTRFLTTVLQAYAIDNVVFPLRRNGDD